MKIPHDGFDADERAVLEELRGDLEPLQARHAGDPPIGLLRAAQADVLPEPMQARLGVYLTRSAWARTLVDGLADADVTPPATLRARLDARIAAAAQPVSTPRARLSIWLAAAAVLVAAVGIGVWLRTSQPVPRVETPRADVSLPSPLPPAPQYVLALEKPPIALSAGALTYRGRRDDTSLATALAPALDAFRADDYARTIRELTPLYVNFPSATEVAYYDGIARLFVADHVGAVEKLRAAEGLADAAFAPDVIWYLAVAEERAGLIAESRAHLEKLCQQESARRAAACSAAERLR